MTLRRRVCAAILVVAAGCSGRADGAHATLVEQGSRLAALRACASCHSVDGTAKVGPTWKGLHGSDVRLESGETVVADDAYLGRSIRDPDAQTVAGFPKGVMANVIRPGSISDEDVRALVAYIRSLR